MKSCSSGSPSSDLPKKSFTSIPSPSWSKKPASMSLSCSDSGMTSPKVVRAVWRRAAMAALPLTPDVLSTAYFAASASAAPPTIALPAVRRRWCCFGCGCSPPSRAACSAELATRLKSMPMPRPLAPQCLVGDSGGDGSCNHRGQRGAERRRFVAAQPCRDGALQVAHYDLDPLLRRLELPDFELFGSPPFEPLDA